LGTHRASTLALEGFAEDGGQVDVQFGRIFSWRRQA
jgi:hypothetical protein